MEKIDTDYKRRIWKIEAKLFNMRKPWLSSFNLNCYCSGFLRVTKDSHLWLVETRNSDKHRREMSIRNLCIEGALSKN